MGQSKSDVLQGTLDLMILKTLDTLGAMHGWGIAQRIRQVSEDLLQLNQGTLYPALLRVEQKGWIASEWKVTENNRRAKYYSLTPDGKKQLEAETARVGAIRGRDGAHAQRDGVGGSDDLAPSVQRPRSSDVGCAPVGSRTGRRAALAHRDGDRGERAARYVASPGAKTSAARIRRRRADGRTLPRRPDRSLDRSARARCSLCAARFPESPWIHRGGDSIARARHRRQCRDLQHGEHAAAASAAGAGCRPIGNYHLPAKGRLSRCRYSPMPITATSASRPPAHFPTSWRITPDSTA